MENEQKKMMDFACNMAAELRCIASELNSASHRMMDTQQREVDPVMDREMAAIDKQYFTLMRLIENLEQIHYLDVQTPLVMHYTDMVTLVGDICEKSEGAMGNPQRHVVFRCPMGTLMWGVNVSGMERALYHLVSNGLKHSQDSVEVSMAVEKKQLVLSVGDMGCGMDEKQLVEALKMPKPAEKYSHGLGLGLPFVQAIATHHGGTLTIESQVGKGTTVTMRLPVVDKTKIQLSDVARQRYVTKSGYNTTLTQLADALAVEAFRLRNQG